MEQPARGLTRAPDAFYFVEIDGAVFRMEPESWKVERVAETGLRGCHDLRWIDGDFYLVASLGNRVARLDAELRVRDAYQIVDDATDVCHANCLAQVNGDLLLSVFTLRPGPREQKRKSRIWRREGKVLRLDWDRKAYEILFEPLSQPHSLTSRDGRLYCCESFLSRIVVLREGRAEVVGRLRGFVRGLDFADDRAFVGVSHYRMKGKSLLRRLMRRLTRWCGVVEVDTETWKPRRRYPPSRDAGVRGARPAALTLLRTRSARTAAQER